MNHKLIYIVAVSGGVDSVVLLHKLASRYSNDDPRAPRYIVAHFDHGIRPESHKDADFVRDLANEFELEFVLGEGKLGPNTSESEARDARYKFLHDSKVAHKADKIITAHHQDDLLETMILNIIRGTGPRGLSPMNQPDILRPLIHRSKIELIEYAREHNLKWREDSTNTDTKYLRNYVRLHIMPNLIPAREELLSINQKIEKLYHDIDYRLTIFLPKQNVISRPWFVGLPYVVQKEIVRAWLMRSGVTDLDSSLIERLTIAIKTLPVGKKTDVNGLLWLKSEKQNVLLTSK